MDAYMNHALSVPMFFRPLLSFVVFILLGLYLSLPCYAEDDGFAIGYGLGQDILFVNY